MAESRPSLTLVPPPAAHSPTDPAFLPDVADLGRLARELCDRLELLVDTAPHDLGDEARRALALVATSSARTLDLLAWLADPTKPTPEPMIDPPPEVTETHTRMWSWRPETLELIEVRPVMGAYSHMVVATWYLDRRPGKTTRSLEVTLDGPLAAERDDLDLLTTVILPWEVGALRLVLTQQALPPVLRAVLRQILVDALSLAVSMPTILLAPHTPRKLGEVGHA